MMRAGLAVGWVLLFVRMVEDLTVSTMLAGPENNVVGFRILELNAAGNYGAVAALTIILTVAIMIVITPVLLFGQKDIFTGGRLG